MKDLLVHSAKGIITGPPTPYSVLQPKCKIKLEDSRFLGYDALKLGESFPKFRKIVKVSSSRENSPSLSHNYLKHGYSGLYTWERKHFFKAKDKHFFFKWSQLGSHYFFLHLFQLLYLFRATMFPSSAELLVSMRHWYFSLCMVGCLVCRPDSHQQSHPNQHTRQPLTVSSQPPDQTATHSLIPTNRADSHQQSHPNQQTRQPPAVSSQPADQTATRSLIPTTWPDSHPYRVKNTSVA